MATQTKKMDWKKIINKITTDKARIAAYVRDPENNTLNNDITFITPLSLPLKGTAGG